MKGLPGTKRGLAFMRTLCEFCVVLEKITRLHLINARRDAQPAINNVVLTRDSRSMPGMASRAKPHLPRNGLGQLLDGQRRATLGVVADRKSVV